MMLKVTIMKLVKRVRGGGSLMHKVLVKRTSEMQPEQLVGNAGETPEEAVSYIVGKLNEKHAI